jgi:MFS family permease
VTVTTHASYRALFDVPGFRRLAASGLLVRTAMSMWQLALVLFVLERFGSPVLAGLAVFVSIAPGVLVSPLAGVLLDRHGRVRLMALDYAASGLAVAALVAFSVAGALTAPLLLLIVALGSLPNPIGTAGGRSLFPLLVPRPLWDRANAADSMGYTLTTIVGPPIAGVLIASVGSHTALAITSTFYLASAVVLVGLRDPSTLVGADRHILREAGEAIAYVARHPTLRGLAVGISVNNLAWGGVIVGLPVLVLDRFGGDAAMVGQLWAILGIAGVVAALLIGRLGSEGRERTMIAASMLVGGFAVALLAVSGSLVTVALAMALGGLAGAVMDVAMFSLRQRRTDPAWFGRAFAVSMHLNYSGIPVGSAIAGPLVASSLALAFGLGAGFCVLAALATYLLVPPEHRTRRVTLFERPDCGLCDEVRGVLRRVGRGHELEVERVDIEADAALLDRYALRVPVLASDGRELDAAGLDEGAIARWLAEAQAR